ncbi:MAG: HEAT repeat domain-containing protein [Aeoliella sp.]
MNYNGPPNSSADESLDDLIRESLRLEEDPFRVVRLERHWRGQSQRQAWRRLAWRAIPLTAAAILAAVFFIVPRQDRPQEISTVENGPERSIPHPSMPDRVTTPGPISIDWRAESEPAASGDSLSAGRPPTAYERILFLARTRLQEPTTPPTATVALEKVIDQLATDPAMDVRTACRSMDLESTSGRRGEVEAQLLEKLSASSMNRKNAIVQLLAIYGTELSLPPLIELSSDEANRRHTLSTIESLIGVERLGEVVRIASDEQVRRALLQRMLTAETPPALIAYLMLVRDETVRDEALAAGAELPKLPIEGFIALLGHEDEAVRLASAVVLGRMNRCEMTEALISRIQFQPSDSKEAWFALFACRCDAADTFLVHATQSPQLLGQFNNARLQWAQLNY